MDPSPGPCGKPAFLPDLSWWALHSPRALRRVGSGCDAGVGGVGQSVMWGLGGLVGLCCGCGEGWSGCDVGAVGAGWGVMWVWGGR